MSMNCYLYRVDGDQVQAEIWLGGNGTRDDIRRFADLNGIRSGVDAETCLYGMDVIAFPVSRAQFADFLAGEPEFYADAPSYERLSLEAKKPGQLFLVVIP